MFDRIYQRIENKRKEVREHFYRVQIYRYHPNTGKFVRKLFLIGVPILLAIFALVFATPSEYIDGKIVANPIDSFFLGLMILIGGIFALIYLVVSPPSCFIMFDEKLGDFNEHKLIKLLQDKLNLIPTEETE